MSRASGDSHMKDFVRQAKEYRRWRDGGSQGGAQEQLPPGTLTVNRANPL